jgi:lauroyl/myristoyl acyltransferase
LRALRGRRHPFVIFLDDLTNDRVQAPSLGRPLRAEGNIAYAARLAEATGAVVIPIYCVRVDDAARFKVILEPPIEMARGKGAKDDVLMTNIARIDAAMTPIVLKYLDQWYYVLDLDLSES